ncbi:hypothetical protein ACC870_36680, partial [Rhizobium ruizarguesonis]
SAMKSARALGFATSRHLHHVPGHDHKRSEGMRSYQSYLNLHGSEHFVSERPFEQNVEDFVSCQHSRDTFAPSKLGDRIARFDAELSELLRSYSNDDRLSFVVCTRIVWGEIKPI